MTTSQNDTISNESAKGKERLAEEREEGGGTSKWIDKQREGKENEKIDNKRQGRERRCG